MREPTPVTEFDKNSTRLSLIFCISEHHGLQGPKSRLIDDLTKSNDSKNVQMSETYGPQGLAPLSRWRGLNTRMALET